MKRLLFFLLLVAAPAYAQYTSALLEIDRKDGVYAVGDSIKVWVNVTPECASVQEFTMQEDMLHEIVQKLLLETKSLLQAQEVYLNYAGMVADAMTGQYQGKTRISHKGNRTSIHFYLSDTDKAVISFFQEKMPWTLPDPPTDPESLRKTCQEEGSPFFIASLSKCDRRILKSYEDE